jgi:hypothetical protein
MMSQAPGSTPESLYIDRLKENRALLVAEQRRDRLLGYTKVALLLFVLIGAVALLKFPSRLVYLSIPVAAFVVFAVWHDRVLQRVARLNRILTFYERGMGRLHDEWAGAGETGERFLEPRHPYARDLDLFGKGSLFEMLCTARTRAGEETLARWLLEAAPLDVIAARQEAIAELKDRVGFRERLFAAGDPVRAGVHPERLVEWGETRPDLGRGFLLPVMAVLSLVWLASLFYWLASSSWLPLLGASIVNGAVWMLLRGGIDAFADATESATADLVILAGVLRVVEEEPFESRLLRHWQGQLRSAPLRPSAAIRKLSRLARYLESRRNFLIRPLSAGLFYTAQLAFAAESWRRRFGPSIRGWLEVLGGCEALADLSAFAFEHPEATVPAFVNAGPLFDAAGLAHPLLPEKRAVRNDLRLDGKLQLMIVSGPNMAGKSTFVRAVGINAVLAQCGSVVQARELRMSPLAIGASICVLDSLQGGVSRFYAEIQRLKLISDMTYTPRHVLFLLDELLSGTNSHDRLAGSQFLVRALLAQGAIGLITTHDLALTRIPEAETGSAVNCHFEDHLEDGALQFDYRLKPGVVRTSNALRLMQSIGLAVEEERS